MLRKLSQVGPVAVAVLLFLLVRPATGQLQVGDNLDMNLNGTLSGGYSANYGNMINSAHSLGFGGTGTLSGSYYNPNFLSFNLTPYLNQSRANSNYRSLSDSSGLNLSSAIFTGSHFPGSINYAKAYNSQGSFGVPGLADFTTHGNSDTFGVNWSENLPDLPSISAGFQRGSSDYSVYGTHDTGSSTFRSFTLHSGYLIDGFGLGAYYQKGASHSLIPQLFTTSQQPVTTTSGTDGYGFNASHPLPLHGGFSSSFSRSSFNSEDQGYHYNGTVDTVNANAGVQPSRKLHLSVSANYSDNLTGSLYQAVLSAGGLPLPVNQNQESHSTDVLGIASYSFLPNLQAEASGERRNQYFEGRNFAASSYGGGLIFTHGLLGGSINAAVSATDNHIDNTNLNTLGLMTTVNYSRRIENWHFGGSFSYAQNQQTLLVSYTTSFYNYSGNIRRRFGSLSWSASAAGSRTGLTAQPGTESHSSSYTTGISYRRWISTTGSYSISHGNAIQTGAGLATTPVPSPTLPPGLLILYGGKSFSLGLGSSPVRKLTIGASYSKATSDVASTGTASWNKNEQLSSYFQYQFRKVYLTGGYAKLSQGFSASGIAPANVSSFYFGVSRWFDFF